MTEREFRDETEAAAWVSFMAAAMHRMSAVSACERDADAALEALRTRRDGSPAAAGAPYDSGNPTHILASALAHWCGDPSSEGRYRAQSVTRLASIAAARLTEAADERLPK